jgi:predicted aminopeptidase
MLRLVLLILFTILLPGCYYLQAAKGQWDLTRKREPIAEVLAAEDTSPELAARLRLVQEARQFSIDELGLPDNKSYRTYADIERDYVVWNVFAAPEFSMEARTWCFPVAGCVSYRGYFSKEDAQRHARRLADKGYDVAIGGVAAYSTLGKFDDPLLSTMMSWDDARLVGVLFHELAHQVLYVKGDSGFNESFATAVEEFGVRRWLETHGKAGDVEKYLQRRQLRQDLMALVAEARDTLQAVYESAVSDDEKREIKSKRLARLAADVAVLLEASGRDPGSWLSGELNNARLVSMTLYEGRLSEFRALFGKCEQRIECFYAEARLLAGR